jgi:hypothetical protein
MNEGRIVLNGIDGTTGQYLVPPMTLAEATKLARGTAQPPGEEKETLAAAAERIPLKDYALPVDVDDENDLAKTGWAVVFPSGTPAAVRKALDPLLRKRRKDAGGLYKELEFKPGDTREKLLARYGAAGSDVTPENVPFYLLLVGGPEGVPFEIECLLNLDYSVGRLAFDRAEDYGRYADALIGYEKAKEPPNGRDVVFWGTRHDADDATQLSSESLIRPLFEGAPKEGSTPKKVPITERLKFRSACFRGEEATKANLLEALHAKKRASLIVTASHGMGFPKGHALQLPAQGALLCQDWPGFGGIKPDH